MDRENKEYGKHIFQEIRKMTFWGLINFIFRARARIILNHLTLVIQK